MCLRSELNDKPVVSSVKVGLSRMVKNLPNSSRLQIQKTTFTVRKRRKEFQGILVSGSMFGIRLTYAWIPASLPPSSVKKSIPPAPPKMRCN